jgi:hypothetical protein
MRHREFPNGDNDRFDVLLVNTRRTGPAVDVRIEFPVTDARLDEGTLCRLLKNLIAPPFDAVEPLPKLGSRPAPHAPSSTKVEFRAP